MSRKSPITYVIAGLVFIAALGASFLVGCFVMADMDIARWSVEARLWVAVIGLAASGYLASLFLIEAGK